MAMDQEKQLKDILDIVGFIKDNAATKEDVAVLKEDISFVKGDVAAIKEDIAVSKDEIMTHIDSFVGLHQKLDMELTALRSKYDRLENSMKKVLDHLHLEA